MRSPLFRHTPLDALLVAAALAHGVILLALAAGSAHARAGGLPFAAAAVGVLLWWDANTVSHNHLHNPLFRRRGHNRAFSLYLSLLLGVPQALWRSRHLWHHAGERRDRRPRPIGVRGLVELGAVLGLWAALFLLLPRFFLLVYVPGYLVGMLLCKAQGHYEHAGRPVSEVPGVSCYGPTYNRLWFNDGFHVEHHLFPSEHWSRLPRRRQKDAPVSGLPPVLRFFDVLRAALLGGLERWALRPGAIQRFMLHTHARALSRVLPGLERTHGPLRRIALVGGGLFPRSALILGELLPRAEFTVIDACAEHLRVAREHLARHAPAVLDRTHFVHATYAPGRFSEFDAIVVPLAYVGPRRALYRHAPDAGADDAGRPVLLVHDWIWRRSASGGVVISWWLLKRLNLVLPA